MTESLGSKIEKLNKKLIVMESEMAGLKVNVQSLHQLTMSTHGVKVKKDSILTRFFRWRRTSCVDDCIITGLIVFIVTIYFFGEFKLPWR